jgi:hypothetical protein
LERADSCGDTALPETGASVSSMVVAMFQLRFSQL